MHSDDLEKELCAFTGVNHCFLCGEGEAMALALKTLGAAPGKAVFVPAFGSGRICEAISKEGAEVAIYDVCRLTFNGDASSLEAAIEAVLNEDRLKPAVIVATDMFGLPADFQAIRVVAERYGLPVLEESFRFLGGALHNKRAGGLGDVAVTDFGAVFTDDDRLADLLRASRVGEEAEKLQAETLMKRMEKVRNIDLKAVNLAADEYSERLDGCCAIPVVPYGFSSTWEKYTIRLRCEEERDRLQESLQAAGISSIRCDDEMCAGRMDFAKKHGLKQYVPLPEATELCSTALGLTIYPGITDEEIVKVTEAVRGYRKFGHCGIEWD